METSFERVIDEHLELKGRYRANRAATPTRRDMNLDGFPAAAGSSLLHDGVARASSTGATEGLRQHDRRRGHGC
jgi:hypothetical protein